MSPLPISRSAMDKLGKRLAADDVVSDDDLDLLLEVLTSYQAALDEAQSRLRHLDYSPTSRTKTTSVLIDKLRREHSSLKSVQDIAGTRIICSDRDEQDEIVDAVLRCFADGARAPKIKDRRAEPNNGYRAVHVIVTVQDLPVEIQIRTQSQDLWAQIVESLGDRWGRQIRYGQPPTDPDRPLSATLDVTRGDLWNLVMSLSGRTDAVERFQQEVAQIGRSHDRIVETVAEMDVEAAEHVLDEETVRLKEALVEAEQALSKDLEMLVSISKKLD
jgi:ppGpp synthetase/RelA/SpoT-type nucleotidyltranferase